MMIFVAVIFSLVGVVSLATGVYSRDWQLVTAAFLAVSFPTVLWIGGSFWGHVPFPLLELPLFGLSPLGALWFGFRMREAARLRLSLRYLLWAVAAAAATYGVWWLMDGRTQPIP